MEEHHASWEPFVLCTPGERLPPSRGPNTVEGLGDRMRTAAFAELQAVHAFGWAAARFDDAPGGLREAWLAQVPEERLHYELIRDRMAELGQGLADRPVTTRLWDSLSRCEGARDFGIFICSAEERGRRAAVRMIEQLGDRDPATAAVFQRIVDDEVRHVALAATYFDWTPA